MNAKWTEEKISYLKDNYVKKSHKEMSVELNIKRKAVSYKCQQLGLIKKRGRFRDIADKYNCIDNYFLNWTVDSAYILGFIIADGHIDTNGRYRIVIGLNKKDVSILEYIRYQICKNAIISNNTNTNSVKVCFSGKNIVRDIVDMGLDDHKANIVNVFNKCPHKYKKHFISGFFDGDGCITYNKRVRGKYKSIEGKVQFTNLDLSFLKEISKFLFENVDIKSSILKSKNWYVLYFIKFNDIKSFYNNIYKSDSFRLQRKLDKFLKFFQLKGF